MNTSKISRRSFLKGVGAAGAPACWPRAAAAIPRRVRLCVGRQRRGRGQGHQHLQLERRVPHPAGSRLPRSGEHLGRRHRHHSEGRHRDPLGHQPQPGRRLPAEAGRSPAEPGLRRRRQGGHLPVRDGLRLQIHRRRCGRGHAPDRPGIDPDTDLADQYSFTRATASDANGVQRGSTWQCCPACWSTAGTSPWTLSAPTTPPLWAKRPRIGIP